MKSNVFIVLLTLGMISICRCQSRHKPTSVNKDIIAENDSVAILYQVVDSAKDEFDIPEVAIWIKNKITGQESKLYQTVRPDWHCWYMGVGDQFLPVPIDSILVTSRVTIYNYDPLQLIVEGCPDMRNEFSYFIDVPSRKAWYVPANQGFIGTTSEEGYMMFQSYRYVSDPDIAGRYTFLQIFDDNGNMVDSHNLEHPHLEVSVNEETKN